MRQQRVQQYREVKHYYASHPFIPSFPSIKYTYTSSQPVPCTGTTEIKVYDMDTLDCALLVKYTQGENPVVLNMANAYTPGGGVERGANAQEESIFRRTNYHLTLLPGLYPMKRNELIYSPNVHIQIAGVTRYLDFIAAAAIDTPVLIQGQYSPTDLKLMEDKIAAIFKTAADRGHTVLILSAFGCGAFHNPPWQVAEIFKRVIARYNGYFTSVIFAILKQVNGKTDAIDNYDIFKAVLC